MKLKNPLGNKLLFRTSIICGIIPLVVGLAIFFIWWAARAFFTIDLHDLVVLGFFWILASIVIACVGLVIVLGYIFEHMRHNLKQALITMALILLNIPAVWGVLVLQARLDKKIYLQLYNDTKQDGLKLTLKGKEFEYNLGVLDSGESFHTSYLPTYFYADARHYE